MRASWLVKAKTKGLYNNYHLLMVKMTDETYSQVIAKHARKIGDIIADYERHELPSDLKRFQPIRYEDVASKAPDNKVYSKDITGLF